MPTHFPSVEHPLRIRSWNELYLPAERLQNISGHVWPSDAESGRPFTLYCADFATLSAFVKLVEPNKHGAWLHSQTRCSPHLVGSSMPKGAILPPKKSERRKREWDELEAKIQKKLKTDFPSIAHKFYTHFRPETSALRQRPNYFAETCHEIFGGTKEVYITNQHEIIKLLYDLDIMERVGTHANGSADAWLTERVNLAYVQEEKRLAGLAQQVAERERKDRIHVLGLVITRRTEEIAQLEKQLTQKRKELADAEREKAVLEVLPHQS